MFSPTRDQGRRFWLDVWRLRASPGLSPLQSQALAIVLEHPEYHAVLEDYESALVADYRPERGISNPFLHMAMHLAVREQVMLDQPPGIRQLHTRIAERSGDVGETDHIFAECLAEQIWQQQRNGIPLDNDRYLECLRRYTSGP